MRRLHTHSQHFLRNPRFVAELIGHTSIKKTDIVYDIGAGKTAAILRKNMADHKNVLVKEADFMTLELPNTPYKIFANIPFSLSSAIVHKITETAHPPETAYLIVQKQFANKLLPNHRGFSSQLGMLLGPRYAIRIRKHLRRTDFWPHPNVDTVLLEITYRPQPLIPADQANRYKKFIGTNFTTPASFAKLPLELVSRRPVTKPSHLTLDQWLVLFAATTSDYS
jgi:23S rRNA (adenine-N6)-dimethyltransferase